MEGLEFRFRYYIIFLKRRVILNIHENKDTQAHLLVVSIEFHKAQQKLIEEPVYNITETKLIRLRIIN